MKPQQLLSLAYSSFNNRDIDGALSLMTENVSWPKASEGGRVIGKQQIREYWTRQWQEFDPNVELLQVTSRNDEEVEARVHQLVRSHAGVTLSDTVVRHVYTFESGLIKRMDLDEGDPSRNAPSDAFRRNENG